MIHIFIDHEMELTLHIVRHQTLIYRHAYGHGNMGTGPHQNLVLAATLTLGEADYAHPILMSPPSFEIHRHS